MPNISLKHTWWIICLLGVAWFCYSPGVHMLNPTEVEHLYQGDLATHYLGWAFYRQSQPSFPLGTIDHYHAPMGTNVGYTDSIPLMAFLCRPFSSLLPDQFQYFGLWLLLCMLWQGYYTWRIMRLYSIDDRLMLLAGTLFVMLSPVWYWRMMHPALCGHFLLLGCLYHYLASFRANAVHPHMLAQLGLVTLSALIHPYLASMTFALACTYWVALAIFQTNVKVWQAVVGIFSSTILLLGTWYIVGYFSISSDGAPTLGLGEFSFNINAFINSFDYSLFIPSLPHIHKQYEGYAYLGLGGILLTLLCLILVRVKSTTAWWKNSQLPFWLVVGGMAVFSLSPVIMIGERVLIDAKLGGSLKQIAEIFRSTGRFIWPLYYSWIIWLIVRWGKKGPVWGRFALPALLILQVIDCWPVWQKEKVSPNQLVFTQMELSTWDELVSLSDSVVCWPPYQLHYVHDIGDYAFLASRAVKVNKPVTVGYVAREDQAKVVAYRKALESQLRAGQLTPNVLYLTSPKEAIQVVAGLLGVPSVQIDGYIVSLKAERSELKTVFERAVAERGPYRWEVETIDMFLDRHAQDIVMLVAKDEASFGLDKGAKADLAQRGLAIEQLGFRGSMAAVIYQDQVLSQVYGGDSASTLTLAKGQQIDSVVWPIKAELYSAGALAGNQAEIKLNGQSRGKMRRGLNLIACDIGGQVIDSAHFDTYRASVRVLTPQEKKKKHAKIRP